MPIPAGPPPTVAHLAVAAAAVSLPAGTVEALRVPARLTADDGAVVDPAGLPVAIALPASGDEPDVWQDAVWGQADTPLTYRTDSGLWATWDSPVHEARLALDGTMTAGRYDIWLRVDVDAETPLRLAGTLELT